MHIWIDRLVTVLLGVLIFVLILLGAMISIGPAPEGACIPVVRIC
jgi:hypothetical protein